MGGGGNDAKWVHAESHLYTKNYYSAFIERRKKEKTKTLPACLEKYGRNFPLKHA